MNFTRKVIDIIPDHNLSEIVFNSSLNPALDCHGNGEATLKHFLLRKPVKHVLEIGTYNGLSAAFMAQFAEKVTTIDVVDYPIKHQIWKAMGVADKITCYVVPDEKTKKTIIDGEDFDVAFVDGNHFGDYPKTDFEMVKHCGRVILHDYHSDFPDVVSLVDSLKAETKGLFAYWEDSHNLGIMFYEFNFNLQYVDNFLKGKGLDMGCGCCPLIREDCLHVDHSPQPKAWDLVDPKTIIYGDAVSFIHNELVDYVFSSHMVEDLESEDAIIDCLNGWAARLLKPGGHIVLLLPDMQGGRYPTVEDGGNPSHRVNVGIIFFTEILPKLEYLKLVQMDTIPHDKGCSFDVVLQK